MADTLLGWLPPSEINGSEVNGASRPTVLDAGCGPGEVSVRLAQRGFQVTGVELAPSLASAARERAIGAGLGGEIQVLEGDLADAPDGPWDHVLCMDVLFHYPWEEAAELVVGLAGRARRSLLFTVAPRTVLLGTLGAVGSLFPRRDRAPRLHPVTVGSFLSAISSDSRMAGWQVGRQRKVTAAVYFSHAVELRKWPQPPGRAM